jgi:Outer membrane protein beta-barrel domain
MNQLNSQFTRNNKCFATIFVMSFLTLTLHGQNISEYYNTELGLKLGSNFTSIYDFKVSTEQISNTEKVIHEISNPGSGFGLNFGTQITHHFNKNFAIQAELNINRISSTFDYTTTTILEDIGIIQTTDGTITQKQINIQVPFLLKFGFGNQPRFSLNTGLYWQDQALSAGGTWEYVETNYWIQTIMGTWVEVNPPQKHRVIQSKGFSGKNTFGYLLEAETIFKIKTWLMFFSVRYQREISKTINYPYFLQEGILLNIGTIIKIQKPEKGKVKKD